MGRRRWRSHNYFGDPVRAPAPAPTQDRLQARLGRAPTPVRGEGRKLATTFWGLAWCRNLEHYHDYANRLPRGRTYLRQGSVLDVEVMRGRITGLVLGTDLYEQQVEIAQVSAERWAAIRERCAGKLSSAIDLLEGRVPDEIMAAVTEPGVGLFPAPREIRMRCSCPDWASMCKHLAALLYGVGLRLDAQPDLLFVLRGVSHEELVDGIQLTNSGDDARRIPAAELAEIFGVLIDDQLAPRAAPKAAKASGEKTPAVKKPAAKKPVAKKPAVKKSLAKTKKTTVKKPAAKKPVVEKSAAKKSAAKKSAAKKSAAKKSAAKKFPNSRKWIDATELRTYGLSAAEVRQWVRDGHLIVVDGREGYRLLPEARRRLRERVE